MSRRVPHPVSSKEATRSIHVSAEFAAEARVEKTNYPLCKSMGVVNGPYRTVLNRLCVL
jgi:hypothetical protein